MTAENKKLPFSHWWHLPVFLATAAVFIFLPEIREAFGTGWEVSGLFVFVALQMLIAAGITAAAIWLRNKRSELLDGDAASMLVDDDVYWKNGWYNNPEDRHLFVQDRMNSMNISMNLGRLAGKIMTGIVLGGAAWHS